MLKLPDVDFHDVHLLKLPQWLIGGDGVLAAQAARELDAICFRLKNSDHAYTYRPQPQSIDIIAGTEATTVVSLDYDDWQKLMLANASADDLFNSGSIEIMGDIAQFFLWEPVWHAMFNGWMK